MIILKNNIEKKNLATTTEATEFWSTKVIFLYIHLASQLAEIFLETYVMKNEHKLLKVLINAIHITVIIEKSKYQIFTYLSSSNI
jgi:hypothetical protein